MGGTRAPSTELPRMTLAPERGAAAPATAAPPPPSPRTRAFWMVWLLYLPVRALQAAAWWALVTLFVSVNEPSAVVADPAARLRWVAIAGIVTAVLWHFPIHGWHSPGNDPFDRS